MAESPTLATCYQRLNLRAEATAAEVDSAYFKLKAQRLRNRERQAIAQLKQAREIIQTHLAGLEINPPSSSEETPSKVGPLTALVAAIDHHGLSAKASIQGQILNLGIHLDTPLSPSQITAKIQNTLQSLDPEDCGLNDLNSVHLYGLGEGNKARWKKAFPMPEPLIRDDDEGDLYSYNNRFSNTLIFPGLLLVGALLSSVEPIKLLLFGVHIWVHEFGHATVAWLSGYRATPLPFGWTNVGESKSVFVYICVLTLLGLLFYTGKKEQSRWSMGLAIGLALLQFCMTWLISEDTFYMLLSFGGIGGEFYLSTLLIASFYFPLPAYWRWDFFRYPAVLFAGFTFISSWWQWRQIDRGLEAIPWGTLFGGSEHIGGDMNQLSVVYGWGDQRIIDTYSGIGGICAIAILSAYFYIFLKQRNYLFLHSLWLRSQARTIVR